MNDIKSDQDIIDDMRCRMHAGDFKHFLDELERQKRINEVGNQWTK